MPVAAEGDIGPPEPIPVCVPTDRRERLLELGAVLLLVLPSLVLSLFAQEDGGVSFELVAWSTIFRDLGLLVLVVFLVWRDGEPLRRLGWTARNALGEVFIGIALYLPFFFLTVVVQWAFETAGLSTPDPSSGSFLMPTTPSDFVLAGVLVVVVAISEETLFRGYLLLRLPDLTRPMWATVLLSAAIFAIGHGYEGTAGVATVGVMGVVFALVYLWRKSLVAPITIHFLQNFLGIVLVPLSMAR